VVLRNGIELTKFDLEQVPGFAGYMIHSLYFESDYVLFEEEDDFLCS